MALIQCHFEYASSIWYNVISQTKKEKVTGNKIIRFALTFTNDVI